VLIKHIGARAVEDGDGVQVEEVKNNAVKDEMVDNVGEQKFKKISAINLRLHLSRLVVYWYLVKVQ
jgi:hypothetical protein